MQAYVPGSPSLSATWAAFIFLTFHFERCLTFGTCFVCSPLKESKPTNLCLRVVIVHWWSIAPCLKLQCGAGKNGKLDPFAEEGEQPAGPTYGPPIASDSE
eukprot:1182769-Amphidinium_carterae.2